MSSVSTLDALNELLLRSPLNRWLGCRVTGFDADSEAVELLLPDRPELRRREGEEAAHGGAIAALVDIAAHAALFARVGRAMPTVDLRVDYLRLAKLPLRARATPRKSGQSLGLADVEIASRDGALAAVGRAVFLTRDLPG